MRRTSSTDLNETTGGDDDDEYIPGEPSLSLHLRVLLVADLASAESICRWTPAPSVCVLASMCRTPFLVDLDHFRSSNHNVFLLHLSSNIFCVICIIKCKCHIHVSHVIFGFKVMVNMRYITITILIMA